VIHCPKGGGEFSRGLTSPIVLVLAVVLVLDFDRYWLGERKAGRTAKRSISGDRTGQIIKKIDNEHEDEDEHDWRG
jgi:hypothetical protein